MIVIWGFRSIRLIIGEGTFVCPTCRMEREFWHKRWKRFFTIYFIPIIPLGDGNEYVECRSCGGTFRADVLKVPALRPTYKARHPIERAMAIIAIVIIVIF